jgi:hypothetical protein
VEKVERFKFLGVHFTDKLKWSTHTDSMVKKAQQSLFNLRRLNKCTDAQSRASFWAVSQLGTAIAPPSTVRLSRG